MKLEPTDSGRKVTCRIYGTLIEGAELYYCPEREEYFIFQNEKGGSSPQSLSPKDKGYKYSWYYFDPWDNWINTSVSEFKFKEEYEQQNPASLADDVCGSPSFEDWLNKYFETPKMKMMYKRKV